MLAGRIALWGLAFLNESDSTRLSQGKQLDFPQFLVSQPNPSSAACITSMDGQRRRELLYDVIAEDSLRAAAARWLTYAEPRAKRVVAYF